MTRRKNVSVAVSTAAVTSAAAKRTVSRRTVPGVSRVARPCTVRNNSRAKRTDHPASHRHKKSVATSETTVPALYCTSPAAPFAAATEAAQYPKKVPRAANKSASRPAPHTQKPHKNTAVSCKNQSKLRPKELHKGRFLRAFS